MFIQVSIAIMTIAQVIVRATTPPACLIGAIGAQSNPADFKAICGNLQQQVISKIAERCADANMHSAAMSAYAATCLSEASIDFVMMNDTNSKPQSTIVTSSKKTNITSVPNSGSTQSTNTVAEQASKPPSNFADCNHPSMVNILFMFGIMVWFFGVNTTLQLN